MILNMQNIVELPTRSSSKMSVRVIVRNEEKNISGLLESISGQRSEGLTVDEIVVASSGSEDRTNELVLEYLKKDHRVRLVVQNGAKGKASVINELLKKSKNEIVVVSSGDVVFNHETLQNLVFSLVKDERIGLTSARPIPIDDTRSLRGVVANIYWMIHHSLERHGETIAFRKTLVNHIPDEVSADEAYVEAIVRRQALRAIQCDNSLIFKKGSESVTEFLSQIRRHYAGHLYIKNSFSYVGSSMTVKGMARITQGLLQYLLENPWHVVHVTGYVLLEATGRFIGIWDFYVRKRYYRTWRVAQTTKFLNRARITRSMR